MGVSSRTAPLVTILASISVAALLSARAVSQEPARQTFGAWGVDLKSRDPRVKAGDDFFAYANGSWLAAHAIPSDQPSTSAGAMCSTSRKINCAR